MSIKALRKIFADELSFVFSCPAILWQCVFLYVPFLLLVGYSVTDCNEATGAWFFTLAYYKQIFTSLYIQIIFRSFFLAALTAAICFAIAYPVAYFLALKVPKRFKTILLFTLIFPSWTSLIVQVYAWFFLLEQNGIISSVLRFFHVISPTQHLLNNYFTIVVGMVSCFLPFMILPIYAVLEKMDTYYLESSADLGANRFETFRRVIFPMSLPGVYAGIMLVFIPSFGEFAIPTLLGGAKYIFWGSAIVDKFLRSRDWRLGSALVIVGIMLPVLLTAMVYMFKKIRTYLAMRKSKQYADYLNAHKELWG
jgi:spermidine/putrescine transport system permease protein